MKVVDLTKELGEYGSLKDLRFVLETPYEGCVVREELSLKLIRNGDTSVSVYFTKGD